MDQRKRWLPDEELALVQGVTSFNELKINWAVVATQVGSRTAIQCREHWKNYHSAPPKPWSPDDVEMLQQFMIRYNNRWAVIATAMNRSQNDVRNHASKLLPKRERFDAMTQTDDLVGDIQKTVEEVNALEALQDWIEDC
jgi:hypothetical protein